MRVSLRCYASAAFLWLQATPSFAQESGRWQEFPLSQYFDSWYDTVWARQPMFFTDSLRGFLVWRTSALPPETGPGLCLTTDGGNTWSVEPWTTPLPHVMRGNHGYSPSGWISSDRGATWRPALDTFVQQMVASAIPDDGPPKLMATLTPASFSRFLRFTTDGGATWTRADSAVRYRCDETELTGLDSVTLFGNAPSDSAGRFTWRFLAGFVDSVLFAVSATGTLPICPAVPGSRAQYYMWRDLAGRSASYWPIASTVADHLAGLTVFDTTYIVCFSKGSIEPVFRSRDGGRSFDTLSALNTWDLRFLSPSYAIAIDRYTIDSGSTWRPWYRPHGGLSLFFALDSLHLFGAGTTYSSRQVIRSTDAGRTWLSNRAAPSKAASAAARNGVVHIAAGPNYFFRSSDSGATWRNIVLDTGAFPEHLSAIGSIARPAPGRRPELMIAPALFSTFDSTYYRLIESDDDGLSWHPIGSGIRSSILGLRFTPTDPPVGWMVSDGTIHASFDYGRSWERRGAEVRSMVMVDGLVGVAAGSDSATNSGTILRTTDGGYSWERVLDLPKPNTTPQGIHAFDSLRLSMLVPDMFQRNGQQLSLHSTNAGASWKIMRPRNELEGMTGTFFWYSPARVYHSNYGDIRYSADSGRHFERLREPWGSDAIAADESFLYLIHFGKRAVGRWRIQDTTSAASLVVHHSRRVTLLPNPAFGNALHVLIDGAVLGEPIGIEIVDVLGRVWMQTEVRAESTDPSAVSVDIGTLNAGTYLVTAIAAGERHVHPLTIIR